VSLDGATLCGEVDGDEGPMEEGWGITIITPAANEPAALRQGHPACLLNAQSHYPTAKRLHQRGLQPQNRTQGRGFMQHQDLYTIQGSMANIKGLHALKQNSVHTGYTANVLCSVSDN
jgi:hypothetical protein